VQAYRLLPRVRDAILDRQLSWPLLWMRAWLAVVCTFMRLG
jgi:hypothetical protein